MKICRLQFNLLVSLSVCLLSGLLLFATPVKAEMGLVDLSIVSGEITVPEDLSFLVCVQSNYSVDTPFSFTLNNAIASSLIFNSQSFWIQGDISVSASYISNIVADTYALTYDPENRGEPLCFGLTGADTSISPTWTLLKNGYWHGNNTLYLPSMATTSRYILLTGLRGTDNPTVNISINEAISSTTPIYYNASGMGFVPQIFLMPQDTENAYYNPTFNNYTYQGFSYSYFNFTPSQEIPPTPEYATSTDNILYTASSYDGDLIPDTYTVIKYGYSTASGVGGYDFIALDRCLDTTCSTTESVMFDDGILPEHQLEDIVKTGWDYGTSFFTIKAPTDRLGTSTSVAEVYKLTPTYQTSYSSGIQGAPSYFVIYWWDENTSIRNIPSGSYSCEERTYTPEECGSTDLFCNIKTGLSSALFWISNPSCSSLNYFNTQFYKLKQGFPFNVYFDLIDTVKEAKENAEATTTSTTIGIPWIEKTSTSTQYTILTVLSTSSLPNAIGEENANVFRVTLGFVIWIFTALIIYITIKKV